MKTEIDKDTLDELVPLARATVDQDEVSFWDRIANFFDRNRDQAKAVVNPRKLKDL